MEDVGLMEQAANFYFTAAMKDRSNADALVALQRSGQWVLDEKIDRFEQADLAGSLPEAVVAYEEALQYVDRVARAGIDLLILESAKQAFKDVRHTHIQELYDAGMEALEDEIFQEALTAFNEVVRLEPGFEDAEKWAQIAFCEPRYRNARGTL